MTSAPLLEIDDVSLRVGDSALEIVKRASFSIRAGEILGIVGESGSGKTMLARAIMGLVPASIKTGHGSIRFKGQNVSTMSPTALRGLRGDGIAMIFQEPMTSLTPSLTIGRQLEEGLELHFPAEKMQHAAWIRAMLLRVGIADPERAIQAFPHEFSGGMRQRIMIACAMLMKPDLLIADEPTTALDAVIQREVMELLVGLTQERGTTVLLISHDLPMIARYSSRVVVMRNGEVVETGDTADVLAKPRHDYTRKLLSTLPVRGPARTVPKADPLISVRDVVVDFEGRGGWFRKAGGKRALHGVTIEVLPNEVVAVVGGSGSGKTTAARVMAGLIRPNEGKLLFKGQPVERRSSRYQDYRYHTQMVFQDPYSSLDPRMKVGELVGEALRFSKELSSGQKVDRVRETLEDVGLGGDYANRYAHEMSGGQRQRVAIARALVRRPAFVIADEAVSALDVTVRAQVLDLFAKLQKSYGFGCLFITHDLGVVEQIADRVVVMNDGRIIEQGTRDEIFDAPKNDYTRRLLSAIPMLELTGEGGVKLKWRGENANTNSGEEGGHVHH
ncbi:dipeptide ABC transporter ATP-binding protein [Brucella cytisi]|uniref:Peptide ABC transporter ATP-binding protein n=1 Tax=Brucella cytisi TaxID=407152 RepID=A0A1J6HBF8_9HYPH|nr:ABC transporter ATP-binding protein [Brucella cytisi]OIS90460.1 peptide ABC transporter ATP-binding protein [Brucella cytisi]